MSGSDGVTLAAAAFGAFLGAGFAFLLEELRRRTAEGNARYSALIQAQLALIMQVNTLVNIQKLYLDAQRNAPDRHMRLVPVHMAMTDLRLDLAPLGFIAEVDDVGVLQTVYLAEQGYVTATTALAISNAKIQETRFDGVLAHGPVDPDTGKAQGLFDAGKVVVLKQLVDGLYQSVDGAIRDESRAVEVLAKVIKRLYPKRKPLAFTIQENLVADPVSSSLNCTT